MRHDIRILNLKKKLTLLIDTKLSFTEIADMLSIDVSNVSRGFKKLIKLKYITKKRQLTQAGFLFLKLPTIPSSKTQHFFRLHNLQFVIKIQYAKKDLYQKIEKLFQVKLWSASDIKFREFNINQVRVRVVSDKVCIYLSEIIAESPEKAKDSSLEQLWEIIQILEQKLHIKLFRTVYMPIRIGSQHIALMNSEIAKAYLEAKTHGLKMKMDIIDEAGNVRLTIDDSKQLTELEFIHHYYAEEDAMKYKDFLADILINDAWKKNKERLDKLEETILPFIKELTKEKKPKKDYIG